MHRGTNNGARTTFLVVEDNDDMRDFLKRGLKGRYRVLTAADGAEGLSVSTVAKVAGDLMAAQRPTGTRPSTGSKAVRTMAAQQRPCRERSERRSAAQRPKIPLAARESNHRAPFRQWLALEGSY